MSEKYSNTQPEKLEIPKNIKLSKEELKFIKSLDDFDLIMFLSELNDYGIKAALKTLSLIERVYKLKKERLQ